MAEAPSWLLTMRSLIGTQEVPGPGSNPKIMAMCTTIANAFPEMESYCDGYTDDDTAWCGLGAANCMAINGIRPPFGATDTQRFLWADSWRTWGEGLDEPKLGAVLTFKREGGNHVAFYEREDEDNYYICGANQSNSVNVTKMPKARCTGIRWPKSQEMQMPTIVPDIRREMAQTIIGFEARKDKNGHLEVYHPPANDGGGAFEVTGINVRYHPTEAGKLKSLIEAGQHEAAETYAEDFILKYTDGVAKYSRGDYGVEFFLRDCAFNRGPTGAIKILQMALGMEEVDGVVDPGGPTERALAQTESGELIKALRSARELYEKQVVGYRENFWKGLVARWDKAEAAAVKFSARSTNRQAPEEPEEPQQPDWTQPTPATPFDDIFTVFLKMFTGGTGQLPTIAWGNPIVAGKNIFHLLSLMKTIDTRSLTWEKLSGAAVLAAAELSSARPMQTMGRLAAPLPEPPSIPQPKGNTMPVSTTQIMVLVRWLLSVGPLAALLAKKGIDPNSAISGIEWVLGVGIPFLSQIWAQFRATPGEQLKKAAAVPDVKINVGPTAPASAQAVAADNSIKNVSSR